MRHIKSFDEMFEEQKALYKKYGFELLQTVEYKEITIDKIMYGDSFIYLTVRSEVLIKALKELEKSGFELTKGGDYKSINDVYNRLQRGDVEYIFEKNKAKSYTTKNPIERYYKILIRDISNKHVTISDEVHTIYQLHDKRYTEFLYKDIKKHRDLSKRIYDAYTLIDFLKEEYDMRIDDTYKESEYIKHYVTFNNMYSFTVEAIWNYAKESVSIKRLRLFGDDEVFGFKVGVLVDKKLVKEEIDNAITEYKQRIVDIKDRITNNNELGKDLFRTLQTLVGYVSDELYKEIFDLLHEKIKERLSNSDYNYYFTIREHLPEEYKIKIENFIARNYYNNDDFNNNYFDKMSNSLKQKIAIEQSKNKNIDFF